MRCHVRIELGSAGIAHTYCYEPLNDDGLCPKHGQQAFLKPNWMSDEQFKTAVSHLHRQSVTVGHRHTDTSDGTTRGDDSGK